MQPDFRTDPNFSSDFDRFIGDSPLPLDFMPDDE